MSKRPILLLHSGKEPAKETVDFCSAVVQSMSFDLHRFHIKEAKNEFSIDDIDKYVEKYDVAMVVVEIEKKNLSWCLKKMRELRVPYIILRAGMSVDCKRISVPVTYLEEEKEKAPFAASFARFLGSELVIHKPKDYGTKAERNIEAFEKLFKSFDLQYKVIQSAKKSEKLEMEAVLRAKEDAVSMVIVSASREYGLDDIIFAPKEKRIIDKSAVPVMLINPRGDLYSLCD